MTENKPLTGYPSIDKPWLKYYSEDVIKKELPRMNIYEYMRQCNVGNLDAVALDYEFTSITYKEMFAAIDAAADSLAAMGIREGDTITSCLPNVPEAIYLIYAAAKLGARIDLIDPLTNQSLLAKYCDNAGSKAFFTLDIMGASAIANLSVCSYDYVVLVSPTESLPVPNTTSEGIAFDDHVIPWAAFIENGKRSHSELAAYRKDMPFAILHTGGTTGIPKGAVLSHDNMNSLAFQVINSPLDMQPGETALILMPPFSSPGLGNSIHVHLCVGMRIRLIPTYDPDVTDQLLLEYKPNRIACAPAHIECLLKSQSLQNVDLSFLHHPIAGGDILALKTEVGINELLERYGCKDRIVKAYGLSESCASICICVNNEVNKPLSVGIPLFKNTVAVFDFEDHDKELPYTEVGEIAVLSPNNMLGYLNMPEETRKTLIRHADGNVWLHTGDIGRIDEDGNVFIDGRMRRMIIQYCGLKSNPFEAEEVITAHPSVKRVVVVGVKDPEHEQGELPVAFVEIAAGDFDKQQQLRTELHRMCEEKVTYYSVPVDYVFVDGYPETSRGKVDYRELSKRYNEMASTRQMIPQKQLKV